MHDIVIKVSYKIKSIMV